MSSDAPEYISKVKLTKKYEDKVPIYKDFAMNVPEEVIEIWVYIWWIQGDNVPRCIGLNARGDTLCSHIVDVDGDWAFDSVQLVGFDQATWCRDDDAQKLGCQLQRKGYKEESTKEEDSLDGECREGRSPETITRLGRLHAA